MHQFDYRFLAETVPAEILGASNIVSDLKARDTMRRSTNKVLFDRLKELAIVDSVKGSNAIEGIVTSRARMKELVELGMEPTTHTEREIVGYKEALDEIYAPGYAAGLSEDLVKHLHRRLMHATSPQAGLYKNEDNWIQQRDAQGRISVRFVPVKASETPEAMAQWVLAYREARQDARIDTVALIACATVDFLCIHPFMDGNGRVSRLVTTVLLQQSGYDIGRYVSIEGMIDNHKAGYYDALEAASVGWHDNKSDYTPFIVYLLQILYACYKELDRRFVENSLVQVPKAQQVEALLMGAFVPLSKAEVAERLPDVSISTIERVLRRMVQQGSIEKIGTYRDARYRRL